MVADMQECLSYIHIKALRRWDIANKGLNVDICLSLSHSTHDEELLCVSPFVFRMKQRRFEVRGFVHRQQPSLACLLVKAIRSSSPRHDAW